MNRRCDITVSAVLTLSIIVCVCMIRCACESAHRVPPETKSYFIELKQWELLDVVSYGEMEYHFNIVGTDNVRYSFVFHQCDRYLRLRLGNQLRVNDRIEIVAEDNFKLRAIICNGDELFTYKGK